MFGGSWTSRLDVVEKHLEAAMPRTRLLQVAERAAEPAARSIGSRSAIELSRFKVPRSWEGGYRLGDDARCGSKLWR